MIKIDNFSFTYENNIDKTLKKINLTINNGEFILVTGLSGSGKTSFIRAINGLIPNYFKGKKDGELKIIDKNIDNYNLHDLTPIIGTVFQDPKSQFFTLDCDCELVFTLENLGINREKIINSTKKIINFMNIDNLIEKKLDALSSGEKQKIAISAVLNSSPSIVIFDEPSANLDYRNRDILFNILKKIKDAGHTVIISEHRLNYLKGLPDRIIYMADGEIEKIYNGEEFYQLKNSYLESKGLRVLDYNHLPSNNKIVKKSEAKLEIKNLTYYYKNKNLILDNLNLSLNGGDIIGIIGDNGVGKTTFSKIICGLIKEKKGELHFNNKKLKKSSRLKNSYFVMQDMDCQLFTEKVNKELILGNEKIKNIETKADYYLHQLGLEKEKNSHPTSLSGGQKQRVSIGVALAKEANIIIFDEPTSGLDGLNMKRVSNLIKESSNNKRIIFIITHDYELIKHCCNRIIKFKNKKIVLDKNIENINLNYDELFN